MTYTEILGRLHEKSSKYAALDQYVAMALKYNISEFGLKFHKAIPYPLFYGVTLYKELMKLETCTKEYVKLNQEITTHAILDYAEVCVTLFLIFKWKFEIFMKK